MFKWGGSGAGGTDSQFTRLSCISNQADVVSITPGMARQTELLPCAVILPFSFSNCFPAQIFRLPESVRVKEMSAALLRSFGGSRVSIH